MKCLMVVDNNIEECEALLTRDYLLRSNIAVDLLTFNQELNLVSQSGLNFKADFLYKDIDVNNYECLIIPGGAWITKTYLNQPQIYSLIKYFRINHRLVAAICAAPLFLEMAGVIKDRNYCCFYGIEKQIKSGTYVKKEKAIYDDGIITARSVGCVLEFTQLIIEQLLDKESFEQLRKKILI